MKKLISILLAVVIVFSVAVVSIFTGSAQSDFRQEFIKFCLGENYDNYTYGITYNEYYMYFSQNNNTDTPDWIFGEGYMPDLSPAYAKGVFGDYCVYQSAHFEPYILGYFVYVPSENKFYDIIEAWNLGFENLELAFEECAKNKVLGIYIIGDADADGTLSITDATFVQRAEASLCDYRQSDSLIYSLNYYGENLSYISDYDRDGERTVMDATAIQQKLAKK